MQTDWNRVRRRALLLIDVQRDFHDDGRMPIARHQVGRVIFEANRAIEDARSRGDAIVAIGNEFEPHDRLMNLLRRNASIAGSAGAMWDRRIVVDGAAYFSKSRSDAFSNARLAPYLADQRVDEVVLSGVFARACAAATARGALSRGMRVRLVESALGDSSDRAKENALRKLGKLPGVVIESAREEAVSVVRAPLPLTEERSFLVFRRVAAWPETNASTMTALPEDITLAGLSHGKRVGTSGTNIKAAA